MCEHLRKQLAAQIQDYDERQWKLKALENPGRKQQCDITYMYEPNKPHKRCYRFMTVSGAVKFYKLAVEDAKDLYTMYTEIDMDAKALMKNIFTMLLKMVTILKTVTDENVRLSNDIDSDNEDKPSLEITCTTECLTGRRIDIVEACKGDDVILRPK